MIHLHGDDSKWLPDSCQRSNDSLGEVVWVDGKWKNKAPQTRRHNKQRPTIKQDSGGKRYFVQKRKMLKIEHLTHDTKIEMIRT